MHRFPASGDFRRTTGFGYWIGTTTVLLSTPFTVTFNDAGIPEARPVGIWKLVEAIPTKPDAAPDHVDAMVWPPRLMLSASLSAGAGVGGKNPSTTAVP